MHLNGLDNCICIDPTPGGLYDTDTFGNDYHICKKCHGLIKTEVIFKENEGESSEFSS